jgi:anti-anti-sigma regulatory factor
MTSATASPTQKVILLRFTSKHLDVAQVQAQTQEPFEQILGTGGMLRLDCAAVESLAPCALMRLMTISRRLQTEGGKLGLLNVQPDVYATLLANRVADLFDLNALS